MSRRRRRETVNSFVADTLTKQVGKLMDNRRRLLAPFPIAAEKIYRAAWTPEERAAIRVCARHKELFRMGSSMNVSFPIVVGDRERKATVTIKLQHALPMPGFNLTVPYDNLSFEQAHAMHEWAPKWLELNMQQISLVSKAKEVGKICKTYGQLYRLWPDILSFFNDAGARVVMNAKVKSPYPQEAMKWRDMDGNYIEKGKLREDFAPEVFAPFTGMIAECLMLPEHEGMEVATVVAV